MINFLKGDGQNSILSYVQAAQLVIALGVVLVVGVPNEQTVGELNTNSQIETVARTATHYGPGF